MGVRLDADQVLYQLALRGKSQQQLAEAAKCSPATLSRCLNGAPIRRGTLERLVKALDGFPILPGATDVVARPKGAQT